MKFAFIASILLSIGLAQASQSIDISGRDQDIVDVIQSYAEQTKQKFIVSPEVRGQISILPAGKMNEEVAFNDLSTALATNGYALSKREDHYVVMSARNVQRSMLDVVTEKPELLPERMVVWVYQFKNAKASDVNRNLRILPSKNGEVAVHEDTNQMVFVDWTSNLNRIAKILEQVDKKIQ